MKSLRNINTISFVLVHFTISYDSGNEKENNAQSKYIHRRVPDPPTFKKNPVPTVSSPPLPSPPQPPSCVKTSKKKGEIKKK